MLRTLFNPDAVMKNANYVPSGQWPEWNAMTLPWASRQGKTDLGKGVDNFNPTGEAASAIGGPQVGESPDPAERTPSGPGVSFAPISGQTFKARLLSLARGPDSRNVEDRRGPDPRAAMTIDEWVDTQSEWRK